MVPKAVIDKIHQMVVHMTQAEIRWTKYVTKDILGFSDESIRIFIEGQANSVCRNLGIPLLYKEEPISNNPLLASVLEHIKGGEVDTKTLFFEGNVADYTKTGPKMDTDNLDSIDWDD